MADTRNNEPKGASCSRRWSTWLSDAIFACCFAGFLNPGSQGSKQYYKTLGIPKNAKHGDIKRAYKRLSFQYHPDKLRQRGKTLTPEKQQHLLDIKRAYEVLSDPERRNIYDSLGINGLELKEDPQSFFSDSAKVQALFQKADKRAACVMLLWLGLGVAYIVIMPILFALQIDGTINTTFALIFLPLWVVYGLVGVFLILRVARGENTRPVTLESEDPWEDNDPLFKRQVALFVFLLFVVFQVLIVAKLDGQLQDTAWPVVLVPYYLFEVIQILAAAQARGLHLEAAHANEIAAATKSGNTGYEGGSDEEGGLLGKNLGFEELAIAEEQRQAATVQQGNIRFLTFRLVQVFLIGLKVGGGVLKDSSWWLVLLPTMIYVVLLCCVCTEYQIGATAEREEYADVMESEVPPNPSIRNIAEHEHKKAMSASKWHFYSSMGASVCTSCCCWLFYVLMLGFFLTEDDFSFFWFYFPWLILFGVPCICVVCVAFFQLCGCCPEDEPATLDGFLCIDIEGIHESSLQEILLSAELVDNEGAEVGEDNFRVAGDVLEVKIAHASTVRELVNRFKDTQESEEQAQASENPEATAVGTERSSLDLRSPSSQTASTEDWAKEAASLNAID